MKIDVIHITKLANLPLKKEDVKKYEMQLSKILGYVEKLTKVNTEGIKETSQTTGLENVTRKDISSPSLSQEEAMANAKNKHNNLFSVKAIFEE